MYGKRKIWALLIALLLFLNTAAAMAGPSITTWNMSTVVGLTTTTGVTLSDAFIIYLTKPTLPWHNDFAAIKNLVNGGKAPIDYFSKLEKEVAGKLPAGTNLQTLTMNEFVPITSVDYKEEYKGVVCDFIFATPYVDGQTIVALAAVYDLNLENDVSSAEWFVFGTSVSAGQVHVNFSQEFLQKLEKGNGSLVILSQKP